MARLAQAMEPAPGAKYPSAPFALIFIRVDEYAEMIETLGRDRVNRVMSALASKINSLLQCEEYLARWSEETFALLCPNVLTAVALTLATNLQKVLNPLQFELSDALVTMRLGFGVVPHQPDMTEEHLLSLAELKAKAALQEGALPIQVVEEKISSPTK
jgi:diguanylate cyclase (GGDEF)-like protein